MDTKFFEVDCAACGEKCNTSQYWQFGLCSPCFDEKVEKEDKERIGTNVRGEVNTRWLGHTSCYACGHFEDPCDQCCCEECDNLYCPKCAGLPWASEYPGEDEHFVCPECISH